MKNKVELMLYIFIPMFVAHIFFSIFFPKISYWISYLGGYFCLVYNLIDSIIGPRQVWDKWTKKWETRYPAISLPDAKLALFIYSFGIILGIFA